MKFPKYGRGRSAPAGKDRLLSWRDSGGAGEGASFGFPSGDDLGKRGDFALWPAGEIHPQEPDAAAEIARCSALWTSTLALVFIDDRCSFVATG